MGLVIYGYNNYLAVKMTKKILVIDDDEMFCHMLKRILERQGDNVFVAEDGRSGVVVFHEESPDLVITDIVMPEQEGLETISQLRKVTKNLPIIAVSGGRLSTSGAYLPHAKGLGADKIFTKLFDHKEFLGAVADCLS